MQIVFSLSNNAEPIFIKESIDPALTEQAREAQIRQQERELRDRYGYDEPQSEIDKKEAERIKIEQERAEQDRLPKQPPAELGKSKIGEDASATSITNRHDNLPSAKI